MWERLPAAIGVVSELLIAAQSRSHIY